MKEGWLEQKLVNVAEIIAGQSPASANYNQTGKGLPFYQGKKLFGKKFLKDPTTWTSKVTKTAFEHDILMSVRAPVGPVNFSSREICIGRGLAAIRPASSLNKNYLFYYLLMHEASIAGNSGAVFNSINKKQIGEILIPVPPLAEQEEIVKVLDKAFAAIDQAKANLEQNIANAKELFQSKLNQIFSQKGEGWEERALGSLVKIKHGFAFKSKFFAKSGDFVLLTPGNYYEEGGYRDRGKKQKYYTGEIPEGFILEKGDLLLAMTEQAAGLLGAPLLVPDSPRFLHNQRLGLVQQVADDCPPNRFLYYLFNTKSFRREIHSSATGVKVRHTSPTKICETTVQVNLRADVQSEVVATLELLNQLCDTASGAYGRQLTTLEELKKSILQKAFTGELT